MNSISRISVRLGLVMALLESSPGRAEQPGHEYARFFTRDYDRAVLVRTNDTQGLLAEAPMGKTRKYFFATTPRPEFHVRTQVLGIRGSYEERDYIIPLGRTQFPQRVYDQLDYARGGISSLADYPKAALQSLREAHPGTIEGITTLTAKRDLESSIQRDIAALDRTGMGTYSGPRRYTPSSVAEQVTKNSVQRAEAQAVVHTLPTASRRAEAAQAFLRTNAAITPSTAESVQASLASLEQRLAAGAMTLPPRIGVGSTLSATGKLASAEVAAESALARRSLATSPTIRQGGRIAYGQGVAFAETRAAGYAARGAERSIAGRVVRGAVGVVALDYALAPITGEQPLTSQAIDAIPLSDDAKKALRGIDGALQGASTAAWKGFFCILDTATGQRCVK